MNEFMDATPSGERLCTENKQVQLLFDALALFLKQPRGADVLCSEWFHDETLVVPSAELLEFFAWDLLYGFGRYQRFMDSYTDCHQAVRNYYDALKAMPQNARWNTIAYAVARRKIIELSGATLHVLHWWPVVNGMELELNHFPQIDSGKRRLTRFVLEAMMLRATFMKDIRCLEGLAEAVKAAGNNPQVTQLIAFRSLLWHPHLMQALGRVPSRRELETFLLDVYPNLKNVAATWVEARKLIRLPFANLRGKKIDKLAIAKLALAARETGPQVTHIPPWKSFLSNEFQK